MYKYKWESGWKTITMDEYNDLKNTINELAKDLNDALVDNEKLNYYIDELHQKLDENNIEDSKTIELQYEIKSLWDYFEDLEKKITKQAQKEGKDSYRIDVKWKIWN